MFKTFRALKQCNSGLAAVEFAFILPIMVLILIGIIESSRIARYDHKLQLAAAQIGDLVTQNETVTRTMLMQYTEAVQQIMEPFDFEGTVIFTSVASLDRTPSRDADASVASASMVSAVDADARVSRRPLPEGRDRIGCTRGCVVWQERTVGTHASNVGSAVGGRATLPNEYEMLGTQNVLVVEVFGNYKPMLEISGNFVEGFKDQVLGAVYTFKPRQDALITPPAP